MIVIPGQPPTLPRHRKSARGGYYDPSSEAKKAYAWAFKMASERPETTQHPTILDLEYHMCMPPSWSRSKRLNMLGKPHTQVPDLTNLIKFTEDALNSLAWKDDKLIWCISARKIWSESGFTRLFFREVSLI